MINNRKRIAAGLLILGAGLAACDTGTSDPTAIDQGFGTKNANADVVLGTVHTDEWLTTLPVTITNHSSKPSDYYIEVVWETEDGTRQIDWTNVAVSRLLPGQVTEQSASFTADVPSVANHFRVAEVSRTAS